MSKVQKALHTQEKKEASERLEKTSGRSVVIANPGRDCAGAQSTDIHYAPADIARRVGVFHFPKGD